MMRLRKITFIVIFICGYLVNVVNATNQTMVKLSTSKEVVQIGEEIELTIDIDNLTAAFTIFLEFDNTKLDYISGPEDTNLIDNRIIHVWYDKTGVKGKNGELGKFRFIAKEEGSAKALISGEFYDEAGELIQTNFNDILIRIDSKEGIATLAREEGEDLNNPNLNLENLAVQNILLYPPFDTTIQNYDIEISNNINELNILAVPENEQSKVEILGNTNLKEGNNRIIITVTSLAGERSEYIINGYKRNSEEEQIYLENKEKEKEQLEEIYKTQQLSNNKNDSKQQENNIYIGAIIVLIFAVLGSIITFRAHKKYHG